MLRDHRTADETTVPFSWIRSVEVSQGGPHYGLPGVAIGGFIGLLVGSKQKKVDRSGAICCASPDYGFEGLLLGAGAGALIGSLLSHERWKAVPLDTMRVAVTQWPGGQLGLGVSLAF